MTSNPDDLRIGIDTGGTFTDAVLFSDVGGVLAKAKARTRVDLAAGIAEALDSVLETGRSPVAGGAPLLADPSELSLVSLSTTLATNALVEGVGGRVALVFIGFSGAELDRAGLRSALGDAPVILAEGGHDSLGAEVAPFDVDAVIQAASELEVDAFAVAGQFSVRNPAHELAARAALLGLGKPVACGHELSAKLNGPKRAVTCLLNARLIGLIAELCRAAGAILTARGIDAPLMIVRGDGSLVSAEFAESRPIETILSGPAASLIGAGHLTGSSDILVSDIGGTTTDVGLLRAGRPTISLDGATVGGHQTMVEAVEMFTFGLGGDSEVQLDPRSGEAALLIGPRRVMPLALLAVDESELVHRTLDGWTFPFRPHDVMFARATGRGGTAQRRERTVLDRIGDGWTPVDTVASTGLEISALRTLVARSQVMLAGFTPTDAAHVLDLHTEGDAEAAVKAADLMAQAADSRGDAVRPNGKALAQWVVDTLIRRSAEAVLTTTLAVDGFPPSTAGSELVQRAIDGHRGATAVALGPADPIVGLGAAAPTYYPAVAALLHAPSTVPEHAEVANAVGAVVGKVRISRQSTISQPSKGQFRVHRPEVDGDLGDLDPAIDLATELLTEQVRREGIEAGADRLDIDVDVATKTATIGGRELFVEATVTVTGTGRPRPRPSTGEEGP